MGESERRKRRRGEEERVREGCEGEGKGRE